MTIVKYKNQSGITYAYESVPKWDPVKKQSRPKRKYLGRVDPETGEIIATKGKRGRPKNPDTPGKAGSDTDYEALYRDCLVRMAEQEEAIHRLEQENLQMRNLNRTLADTLSQIRELTDKTRIP